MKKFWIFFGIGFCRKLKFEKENLEFNGIFSEECQKDAYPNERVLYQPKVHEINLDLPPSERWTEVGKLYSYQLKATLSVVTSLLDKINPKIVPSMQKNLPKFAKTFPKNYMSEMSGLADAARTPVGDIILYNIFYEIFAACTSVVAKGEDGLIHGRNLDFGLLVGWDFQNMTWPLAEALRPSVITLEFQKNNQTIFTSAGFIGYIGILTGVRAGQFSFSANRRFSLDGGWIGILEWILGKHSANWLGFFSRDVFQNCETYACAHAEMMKFELVSPVYFIIADGTSENASIIVRDREKVAGTVSLGDNSDQTKSGSWFLLQTNYDPWKKTPFFDDRRNTGIKCLLEAGIKGDKGHYTTRESLFGILSTKPNLNMLTVYTSLINLKNGKIETFIRKCPFPCIPW